MVADAILLAQIRAFAEAGADAISVHAENGDLDAALALIAELGLVPGVVLQLETPVAAMAERLDRIGFLTLLGTRIGVKGQDLDGTAMRRIERGAGADRRGAAAAAAAARRATAATGRIPCRCCGRRGPRRWCWARSPSAIRTCRRGWPGCTRCLPMPDDPPAAIGIDLGGTQARVALVRGGAVVRRSRRADRRRRRSGRPCSASSAG